MLTSHDENKNMTIIAPKQKMRAQCASLFSHSDASLHVSRTGAGLRVVSALASLLILLLASPADATPEKAARFYEDAQNRFDGNDLPVALAAVQTTSPQVLVVEYNAKFPYPLAQCIKYDPAHSWNRDDYHGASLGAWVEQLEARYRLVCCNLAGTNAFFVRLDLAGQFSPHQPAELYQPARFYLTALRSGHPPSLSFLANHLNKFGKRPTGATP